MRVFPEALPLVLFSSLALVPAPAMAQDYNPSPQEVEELAAEMPEMLLHPLYDEPYVCSEHPFSTSMPPGDALGQDCLIVSGIDWATNSGFMTSHVGDGARNEDWYGWGKPVFAPMAGTISAIHVNDIVNDPGTMVKGRATSVVIVADEGQGVVIAHLGEIAVEEGQRVAVGDKIGTVGNNGNSRSPHIHIGAIDAEGKPAQVRWNLVSAALRARDYIQRLRASAEASDKATEE